MKVKFANNIPTVLDIASLCGGKVYGAGGFTHATLLINN